MKILNFTVAAIVGTSFLLSGVAPANSDTVNQLNKNNTVKSITQIDSLNTFKDDSDIIVDGSSGDVKVISNGNFGNLDKTKPYKGYENKSLYVSGENKRPVGIKTKVRFQNMLYSFDRTMKVQKYNSKKKTWTTVVSKKTPKMKNNSLLHTDITIPALSKKSKSQKIAYRIYLPKTKTATSYTSKKFSINYVNPRFYKGYKKTIYNDIKKADMCPNVVIETGYIGKNIAGRAWFGTYKMKVVNGLKGKYRQRVSVHECAHLKSGVSYKEDISKLRKESNKLFKLNKNSNMGVEYLADCMSFAKMGKRYIPGYKKFCSSSQIKKAKRVWAGKKIY